MRMERLIVPKEVHFKRTKYQVYYMMKGHNTWHLENECVNYDTAYNLCLRLEQNSECFTEIRVTKEDVTIYRFYDYFESQV